MSSLSYDNICKAGLNYESNLLVSGQKCQFVKNFDYAFNKQKKRAFRLQIMNNLPTFSNIKFKKSLTKVYTLVNGIIDNQIAMDVESILSLMVGAKDPETGDSFSREE